MPPTCKNTEILFSDGVVEQIGDGASLVLEHGGWVSITDRVTDYRLGGYLTRTRSYPPASIRRITYTRKEDDD